MVTQDSTPSGLEVLSKTGNWIKAPPVSGAFVVNIADCFMRQTNDYFVSTVHRVVNQSGRERYSLPFFFGFDGEKVRAWWLVCCWNWICEDVLTERFCRDWRLYRVV